AKVRFWSAPSLSARSFDCPRTRSPSRPTATTSTAVPTNATSSLVWTLAGTRPTARTRGLSAGLRSRRLPTTAAARSSPDGASDKGSGAQRRSRHHHVGDQPASVDLRNVLIGAGAPHDLARLDVDVVALEVQRASVAVGGGPD